MTTEDKIWEFLEGILGANYTHLSTAVLILFIIFWLFVCWWIYNDIVSRTKNRYIHFFSVLLVLLLNVLGLLIYLIIRPKDTLQEAFWADLERRYLLFETAELGDCDKCGYQLRPGFTSCPNCGYDIKFKCSCGALIEKNWKYCPYCGANSAGYVEQLPTDKKKDESPVEGTINKDRPKYASKAGVENLFAGIDRLFDKIMAPFIKKKGRDDDKVGKEKDRADNKKLKGKKSNKSNSKESRSKPKAKKRKK